tara:strand:+ start:36 stop:170 length:135 start_codon:yes stop_codon:yes gene_type:complete
MKKLVEGAPPHELGGMVLSANGLWPVETEVLFQQNQVQFQIMKG